MHTSNTDHDETLKDFRIAINQLVDDDNMPEVLALIEKDRERAIREARLDELNKIGGLILSNHEQRQQLLNPIQEKELENSA